MKPRYVLRRRDTMQFFKPVKSAFLKRWKQDDPRRKQWTDDIDKAALYDGKGIKPLLGHFRNSLNTTEDKGVEFEAVKIILMQSGGVFDATIE